MNRKSIQSVRFAVYLVLFAPSLSWSQVWTSAKAPDLPKSFTYQGEYGADNWGAQVIALGPDHLQVVLYSGGLPGDGWNGSHRSLFDGVAGSVFAVLCATDGDRHYLAASPLAFSAAKEFPPQGQRSGSGMIHGDTLTLRLAREDGDEIIELDKVVRMSPTMGAKPPTDAIVLFDGTSKDEWNGGRIDEVTHLLNTDGNDMVTKQKFTNYRLHLEFLLPFRPDARGQGRGNSGFYQVDMYEMQILDSFGLEGVNNECGGIYQLADPKVNMCLPPLVWQTYDVEFHNAVTKDETKISNAILTAKHNGVFIHDQLEIREKTGGARNEPEGTPGPIRLQGHGNPVQFRNIWIERLPDAS